MAQQRRHSVYDSLQCGIGSTIPKRTVIKDSWVRKSFHSGDPINFTEGSLSDTVTTVETIPDEGYVKRKTLYFESQPLDVSQPQKEEKPKPQETESKIIKYRVKKSCFGYPEPSSLRRTMTVVGDFSRCEFEFVDTKISKEENGPKRATKRNPIVRRHTTHVSPRLPIVAQRTNEIPAAPNVETKSPQKRVLESSHMGRRSREVPDTDFIPDSSGSDAVVDGCGGISLRGPSFHADLNSAGARYKLANDAGIMNGLCEETASVPRVIGAAIKSYKDIPEELFNTLPESSVDPNPDGGLKEEGNSEWTNMLEGRRALLLSEGSDRETERNLQRDPQRMPIRHINSTKTSYQREAISSEELGEQPSRTVSGVKSCPNPRAPSSRHEGDVVSKEYLRQLERDLQEAGVFFRFPSPPPPFDEEGAKGEVSVALATLDASLDGFSCSSDESSGESASQTSPWAGRDPHASSMVEVRQSTVESSNGSSTVDASRAKNERPSVAPCHHPRELLSRAPDSSITMRPKSGNYRMAQMPPNGVNKTIIRVGGSANEGAGEKANGRALENLNLIEEVYVRSRTKELVPESSVQMKAYYPSVDFCPRTSPQPVQIVIDSDSGHESGATSPCGTLTGEETSSPPPSPSVQKDNPSANTRDHNSDNKDSALSSENFQKLSNHSEATMGHGESPGVPPINSPINPPQISPDLGTVVVSQTRQEDDQGMAVEESSPPHFVVIAIDFGTTYSGYAFSFTRDPDNVHMMKKWEGGDPGIQNQKTPTIVLLTPEEEFHSLGFGARDTFHDLEPKDAQKWLYFDRFKMELHSNQSLTRDTLLMAKNGKTVPALKIFAFALRYFRDHAIKELSEQTGIQVEEEDIRWVITVPAIWSLPAKQFMRTAAYQAGMAGPTKQEKLLIALEPEAAAIYCRKLRQNQLLQDKTDARLKRILSTPFNTPTSSLRSTRTLSGTGRSLTPELDRDFVALPYMNCEKVADWLCEGTVYMVVDCGGGTVDITVHQMTDRRSGHLKELHKATGGPFGSIGVDQEFEELLNLIFGEEFMSLFKKQRSAAYVDLMIAFESRKRNASPYKSSPLNIALPFSFIDLYKKTNKKEVENAIRKQQHLGIKWSSQGMLRIDPETMKRLFQPTLEKISKAIRSVLSSPEVGSIQYMFLVGGFAESELLQKHIRDSFGDDVNVIIPQGMGLAILRGAVQFGLDPSVVTVRRSRLTYGVGVLNRFEEGIHPLEKKVVAANSEWCADILDKFVVVDESIAIGDVVTRSYTPATPTQKSVILHLYATPESNVRYVTDPSVQRVGTLHLQLGEPLSKSLSRGTLPPSYPSPPKEFVDSDEENKRREITVHLKFGGTEVKASAVDHFTGQCVKAVIEFLAL